MVIKAIKHSTKPQKVITTFCDKGYLQGDSGSLPDVDVDFQSDRRQEVKEYLERRYNHDGKQRVFSAGTLTTLKVKAALTDVARVHRVPVSMTKYITPILDECKTWTDLFKVAYTNGKVKHYIDKYPFVIEDMRTILDQPRSSSVHASALLIAPDTKDGKDMECFDFTPIKKQDGILVSEFDGYTLDEQGLLKNDCLGIKELSKLQQVFSIVNKEYKANLDLLKIVSGSMDDPKVYELFKHGYTQNIFQFSSKGMTGFIKDMTPTCINDLIAANALFRPATLESGSTQRYTDCKNGLVEPTYLWGTYNALKDTYGVLTYQEDLSLIAREVGGFSLGEGVKLVKLISKKKVEKIKALKGKFLQGAKLNGCPEEDANEIWQMFEAAGGYLFNKCISGKEYIRQLSNCGRCKLTIEEMWLTLNDRSWAVDNGHSSLHDKYKKKGYGTTWSMKDGGRTIKNNIVDIRYMGKKPLYRITLENGATIDVTANHKHPTTNGQKRTDELAVGKDSMYIIDKYEVGDTNYRYTDKGKLNNERYHSNTNVIHYTYNVEKGLMGFQKRDTEYTDFQWFREHEMSDRCEICGKKHPRLEVHHKNGDHSRAGGPYDFSNLMTLCPSCHKKEHYKMGRVKFGEKGLLITTSKVVSVEYIGIDRVFDVEMEDPYHNFANDNGIFTCNSHATAYAITAYCGAYLKAHYPTAFYTVALQWADDKEIPTLISEMEMCSHAKIVSPDINVSDTGFVSDYKTNEIFWSLTRIKMLGEAAANWIIEERNKNGMFTSVSNFIDRVFKYKLKKYEFWDDPDDEDEVKRCPVNARHVRHLIFSGCFDNCEGVRSVIERWGLLKEAANKLGFEIKEKDVPEDLRDKHWFWSQQQLNISGWGLTDYHRIFDNSSVKPYLKRFAGFETLKNINADTCKSKVSICANVVEVDKHTYISKKDNSEKTFLKLILQQNTDITEMVVWDKDYNYNQALFDCCKGRILICGAQVRLSDYSNKNELILSSPKIEVI